MKEEIAAAVFFVARLAKRHGSLDAESRERFAAALTSALFETYKTHWYPHTPVKGQAYRCLRMNRAQLRDPVLERACVRSVVCYEDLGLPREITIWVDPGEVSCRYGERSVPFCVMQLQGCHHGDGEFSRRIHNAVERAASDIQSGSSSDEGGDTSMSSSCSSLSAPCPALGPAPNPKPKTIPTVSNPNSVYQFSEFAPVPPPPAWSAYPNRKAFPGDGYPPHGPPSGALFAQQQCSSQFRPPKGFRPYRAASSFTGPRQDKYHWVSKNRS
ncbi:protein BTG4 isoform X1 [Coregonus clupeaformis]|uniref:protein BTG4 isoform X1 n=1 Tax=Coregonus clupeaformis TaxID=59861 RepID=UPI001BDF75D5|nr:protein BTG4 isoform X1 [Coregonus clupeaformis]